MASADRVAVDVKPNYGSIPLDPPADPPPVRGKAGPLATGFNVVNVYLGLGLLAQAYALQRGGWVALVLMGVCCAMCAYTGQLVVACFRAMQERTVCARDAGWADLAEYVLGTRGKWLVFGIALVEAFGAGCMALLMLWRNLEGLMPKVPSLQIELWTLIAIVPALFAQGFNEIAIIGILGAASKALTAFLPMVVYFTLSPTSEPQVVHRDWVRPQTLPMAMGIIMLSYSAHVALPSLYRSMADPARFTAVTNLSFLVMLAQYVLLGTFGYVVWGRDCSPLITYDATTRATERWQILFTEGVSVLVAWSLYATVIPIITVVAEMALDARRLRGAATGERKAGDPEVALKLLILAATAGVGHMLQGYLGYVEVLLGVLSLLVTLLIPLVFTLRLFGPEMSRTRRAATWALFWVGCLCMCLITSSSVQDLRHNLHD